MTRCCSSVPFQPEKFGLPGPRIAIEWASPQSQGPSDLSSRASLQVRVTKGARVGVMRREELRALPFIKVRQLNLPAFAGVSLRKGKNRHECIDSGGGR